MLRSWFHRAYDAILRWNIRVLMRRIERAVHRYGVATIPSTHCWWMGPSEVTALYAATVDRGLAAMRLMNTDGQTSWVVVAHTLPHCWDQLVRCGRYDVTRGADVALLLVQFEKIHRVLTREVRIRVDAVDASTLGTPFDPVPRDYSAREEFRPL